MTNIRIPHAFTFLFWIIIACSLLSYIIPSGSFERIQQNKDGLIQTIVVQNSYQEIPKHYSLTGILLGDEVEGMSSPNSLLQIFSAVPKGLEQSAALIFFVLIIGAVICLIYRTGAFHAVLHRLITKFKDRPKLLIFLTYMVFFTASSFMGIGPEIIALIPVFLLLSKQLGYDRIFGFALMSVPILLGWSSGVMNPFTVQIAQSIAELPIGSGIGFRLVIFVVFAGLGYLFLLRYADRIQKDPASSKMADDNFDLAEFGSTVYTPYEPKHGYILLVFVGAYAAILTAVRLLGWGLIEMSAGFLVVLYVVSKIANMSGKETMSGFTKGLEMMILPALVIGVARGISVVLQESMIIDTILYHAGNALAAFPKVVAVEGMLVFQSGLNFFKPSASGQALVSMPILTPMADLLDISRQTTVLTYILGDGLSNLIIPTNGVLMAYLAIAKVPFGKWFRFVLPLFSMSMLLAFLSVALAVIIGY